MAIALGAALSACGPGTGGTGVGPIAGTYISVAAPVGTPIGAPVPPGTAPPTAAGIGYVLVLDPLAIRLTGACLAFQVDGAWAEANGEIRVTGSYRQAAPANDLGTAPALAGTLVVRVQSTGLMVTLLDARGTLVLGITTGAKLADGAVAVTAPACKSLAPVVVP